MLKWASNGKFCKVAKASICQNSITQTHQLVITLQQNKSLFQRRFFAHIRKSTVFSKPCSSDLLPSFTLLKHCYDTPTLVNLMASRNNSTSNDPPPVEEPKLSRKEKLKRAVKDYGATVIIFHIMISLTSLGISYLAISSGVDVASLLDKVGIDSKSDFATGASTFVVAYAVHKVFAPVRISITLGATPFIVRYLRRVGVLKPPKTSGPL